MISMRRYADGNNYRITSKMLHVVPQHIPYLGYKELYTKSLQYLLYRVAVVFNIEFKNFSH